MVIVLASGDRVIIRDRDSASVEELSVTIRIGRGRISDGVRVVSIPNIARPHRAHVTWDELIVGVSKDPFAPPEKRKRRFIPLHRVEAIEDVTLAEARRKKK
jgi:hypothetical protein